MKNYDFVHFLTKEIMTKLETPKEKKEKMKLDSHFFFGQIPFSIKLFFHKYKKKNSA